MKDGSARLSPRPFCLYPSAFRISLAVLAAAGLLASAAFSAEPAAPAVPAGDATVVLDHNSLWRTYAVDGPTGVRTADGKLVPMDVSLVWSGLTAKPAKVTAHSPLPPASWTGDECDDSSWPRIRLPKTRALTGQEWVYRNSLVVLRGKFAVPEPAQVKSCVFSLTYFGGAVVYVNGKEVARGHVPADKPGLETPAEDYPAEAYHTAEGKLMFSVVADWGQSAVKNKDRLALRERRLTEVKVPVELLRKGVNVLAVEIHAAPTSIVVFPGGGNYGTGYPMANWPPIGALAAKLTVSPAGAALPGAPSPKSIQVWNCAPYDNISVFDCGILAEPLRPIAINAPRNGVFSGRLAVSSDQPIKGLKVTVGDLVGAGDAGKIPASAVRVRYSEPAAPEKSWVPAGRFDGLLDAIPAEVPVAKASPPRDMYFWMPIDRSGMAARAVAPLWFTVKVPKDAKPGKYEGTVTVAAEGLTPVAVPLRVGVCDWTMPDPKDFRVANFFYYSEDALAQYYGVPRWSDKHFELLGKSLGLLAEVNSREAIANLVVNFYGGNKGGVDSSNAESLVRWIRQPDGSFKHDFSLFDKYLDNVAKAMGKPTLLRVNCWGEPKKQDGKLAGGTLAVTVLDPATGKTEPMAQPVPGTEESLNFWKPVLEEVRKKAEARGWWDVTAIGHNTYCWPPLPEVVDVARKIWADGHWSYTGHNGTLGMRLSTLEKGVTMPVRHADCLWTGGPMTPRGYRALLKPRPNFWCHTLRENMRDYNPLVEQRRIAEGEVMCGQDGWSDSGADLFPLKAANGRYYLIGNGRGTGGASDGTHSILAPGPDGAVATERFEMFREGVELAEALIFIQRAIEDKKISGDLEARANRYLDERGEAFMKGWFNVLFVQAEQDEKLLGLAGEVARAIK
jgi:hypothetical protein